MVEVEIDSSIWLANTGTQPIRIEQIEVVAMAECVTTGPGASSGEGQNDRDEVNGLVEREAPHVNDGECQQLRAAMAARKHLFARGKGNLGWTDCRRLYEGYITARAFNYQPSAKREVGN